MIKMIPLSGLSLNLNPKPFSLSGADGGVSALGISRRGREQDG